VHDRSSSVAVLQEQLDRRTHELSEALEQQKATAEILRVIRTSPADVQPVFETIVRNAVSLCGSLYAHVFRFDGELLHLVASHNVAPSLWRHYADFLKAKYPMRPDSSQVSGRVLLKKSVVRLEDARADPDYDQRSARGGWRRVLGVPMLREGEPLGVIVVGWAEAGPVPKVQEELLKTFAEQAVIAIENARLLNELRQSLEQQTATADVLRVISSSPGELEPVFQTMLENATRICEAKFGTLFLRDDDAFRVVATHNAPPAYAEARQREPLVRPPPDSVLRRVSATKQVVHITDAREIQSYIERNPYMVAGVELGGYRTILGVPMLKQSALIGVVHIYRQEVRPFSDKQIALLQNFAAQAIIAIENTRLLNELRQSLEQQTATADVLRVISSSPGELEPVFQSMLEKATQLCEASFGSLLLLEGENFRRVALHNTPAKYAEFSDENPLFHHRQSYILNRLVETKQTVHVSDMMVEEPEVPIAKFGNARTLVVVPMLKENQLVGAINIYRQEVRPFTEKQIELLQNFANQAVIAIDNARLLTELRESLQQQTATADVLRVISSSPGELTPVFDAILANATRICEAKFGTLTQVVNGIPRLMFQHGVPTALEDYWRREMPRPGAQNVLSRVVTTGQAAHVTDYREHRAYLERDPLAVAGVELGGIRTLLVVPMLKDEKTFGTIGIYRQEVRPFNGKQIELVSNFAAQAAIAIENTRLLNELQQRTTDLTESLEQQTATSRVLEVISRSAFDLQGVFETVAESSVRLCGADRAFIWRFDGELLRIVAVFNAPQELKDFVSQNPIQLGRYSASGRAALVVKRHSGQFSRYRYSKATTCWASW
jgi:GAF domain-containing protein